MVDTADWLVYSLRELSREFRREDLVKELDILRKRVVYLSLIHISEHTRQAEI